MEAVFHFKIYGFLWNILQSCSTSNNSPSAIEPMGGREALRARVTGVRHYDSELSLKPKPSTKAGKLHESVIGMHVESNGLQLGGY